MQLKEYQQAVLDGLSRYLATLTEQRRDAEEYVEFQRLKGRTVAMGDYCRGTWEALAAEGRIPRARDAEGRDVPPAYIPRADVMGRPVPNICLKVPTGGGKTLLACAALERINAEGFNRQTGFVLWVVPSDAIYSQTWRALANREHPYRQMLERASGGRVRLLERTDAFHARDVKEQLCVMLLMLPAASRQIPEQLRMFRDGGRFPSFFPEVDDVPANLALLAEVPSLAVNEELSDPVNGARASVKQSLGNVLQLARPIIVVDEGHKAYSETAVETLGGFNPRFILELSATPNAKIHQSNVLVSVTGTALREEQMIKLPINLVNIGRADWRHALAEAHKRLDELQATADRMRGNEGRYIRPILLVRVDFTGQKQREREVHAEGVREYLMEKLGAAPEQIKVKSAETDELGDEDLLSEYSRVRYVITKDALREGWDCPFAYVSWPFFPTRQPARR